MPSSHDHDSNCDISIIICTYNRCENLDECFTCLSKQEGVDAVDWEVLLVDNNSSDDTRSVTESWQRKAGFPLRYAFESEQGLSAARNHGLNEARGKYLVFIDDDIRVTPGWLKSIYDTFTRNHCDAVGGRIHVQSPEAFPKWITPDMYGFLGHQDFGEEEHRMDGIREFPFGGNMAIRKDRLQQLGGFDVRMGRKGSGSKKDELFKGEETDLFHRLTAAGGTIYYQPGALVYHKILPYQLQQRFFLTIHNNAGLLKAKMDANEYPRRLFCVPNFIYPQLLRSIGRYLAALVTRGYAGSFRKLMTVSYFLGLMKGYREQTRSQ